MSQHQDDGGVKTYLGKNGTVRRVEGDGTKGMLRELSDHLTERGQEGLKAGNSGDVLALRKRDGDIEEQHISMVRMAMMRSITSAPGSLLAHT